MSASITYLDEARKARAAEAEQLDELKRALARAASSMPREMLLAIAAGVVIYYLIRSEEPTL